MISSLRSIVTLDVCGCALSRGDESLLGWRMALSLVCVKSPFNLVTCANLITRWADSLSKACLKRISNQASTNPTIKEAVRVWSDCRERRSDDKANWKCFVLSGWPSNYSCCSTCACWLQHVQMEESVLYQSLRLCSPFLLFTSTLVYKRRSVCVPEGTADSEVELLLTSEGCWIIQVEI